MFSCISVLNTYEYISLNLNLRNLY